MLRLKDYWDEDDRKKKIREEAVARDRQIGAIIMLGLLTMFPIVMLACNDDASTVTRQVSTTPVPRPERQVDPPVVVSPAAAVIDTEPASLIPENPTFEDGEVAYGERRYEDAREIFARWNTEHPDNVWGHYMAGLAALKSGLYEESEDQFALALEQDPTHVKSLRNVVRLYLETNRPEEALGDIEFAIELDPESGENYRLLALVQTDLGLTDDAIESYRRALTLDSTDAWSMNNLGLLYIRDERFGSALGPLARAVQLRDDIPVFYNNLGVALERNGYLDDARDAFAKAVDLDGGHQRAVASLARIEARDAIDVYVADLEELAQGFASEIDNWREPVASEPIEADTPEELPAVELDDTVTQPPVQTGEPEESATQLPPPDLDYESISEILQLP